MPAAFVDAEELPGALRPTGQYETAQDRVTVTLFLVRGRERLGPLVLEGVTSDLPALANRIARAAIDRANAPGNP